MSDANIFWSHNFVMGRWMMFGEVVGQVFDALLPVNFKLLLCHAIAEPVESHIPGFGATLAHVGSGELKSSRVISFDGCWWLGMIECDEGVAEWNCSLAIVEDAERLRLGSGCNNWLDAGTLSEDRAIVGRVVMGAEVEMPSDTAACIGEHKVG